MEEELEEEEAVQDPPAEVEETAPSPPRPVRVTELQRLAYTVRQIDNEVSIVPVGAYLVTDSKAVIQDSSFRGLPYPAALSLGSWRHFRPPTDPERLLILAGGAAAHQSEFLDKLDFDSPSGSWVIREDLSAQAVIIRSLLWQGYSAYHIPGTNYFGGAYFGNGSRTDDLAFLLF